MKVTAARPLPQIYSNTTDKELIDVVRHFLPNPSQAIDELLNRFEARIAERSDFDSDGELEITCPNCGSELELKLDT